MARIQEVHISEIVVGDTVEINGVFHTVGRKDLRFDPFMGLSLRGDCYKLGLESVRKVTLTHINVPLRIDSGNNG